MIRLLYRGMIQWQSLSTAEIGKVFDAFNTVSAQLKIQGQALESVKNSLQDLTADLQELKEDRRVLLEKVESLQENNAVDDGKIPPEISISLKMIMVIFTGSLLDIWFSFSKYVINPFCYKP